MAAQLEKMQRDLIETKLLETLRDEKLAEINRGMGIEQERKILNEREYAEVAATVNQLLLGRDAWLKQMRETETQKQRRVLLVAEEQALNDQVDVLLRDVAKRNFIATFKYESDDVPDTAPKNATGFEAGLEGMLSKITGGLGDGPFAFIGKLLQQIFSFIFPLISAFKEMGKKTVPDLVKEGSLDEADAELTLKENELINKLRPLATDHNEIKQALEAYEASLGALKEISVTVDIDGKDVAEAVEFEQASESHQRNTLMSRMKILNELSSSVAPGLAAHEELVAAQRREALKQQKLAELTRVEQAVRLQDKDSKELDVLNARMEAVRINIADLQQKREDAKTREELFVRGMAGAPAYVQSLFAQNDILVAAEQARQKNRITEEKKAQAEAEAETAHRRAVELAQAQQHRAPVAPLP